MPPGYSFLEYGSDAFYDLERMQAAFSGFGRNCRVGCNYGPRAPLILFAFLLQEKRSFWYNLPECPLTSQHGNGVIFFDNLPTTSWGLTYF